jgi:imidazolonepropionase-like amidohydrolase
VPHPTACRLVWCGLGAVLCARAAAAQSPPPALVLTGAHVIDGVSARPLANATVVVRDGRIASVSTTRGPVPAGARVVDLGGRWVLPA